jgi:hypothetical protein
MSKRVKVMSRIMEGAQQFSSLTDENENESGLRPKRTQDFREELSRNERGG